MNNPFRSPEIPSDSTAPPPSIWFALPGILLSAVPAILSPLAVEDYRKTFAGFGTELPVFTALVLDYHLALWLIPIAVAAIASISAAHDRARRTLTLGIAGLFLSALIFTIAAYLPIFALAETGG